MNLYICEICGEAYIGVEKPSDCPFCGAKNNFIKLADEAKPIVIEKSALSEVSRKNLKETLALEIRASAIYTCMAKKSGEYKIQEMYNRLANVELEHALVAVKLLSEEIPEIKPETCSNETLENFKKTIELEDHAVELYRKFVSESTEEGVRKFFGALIQVEAEHAKLIKSLLG